MSFVSYAQNCEDVLLWRALGHVRNGFYIDVGANDPVLHSVSKAFYDSGWSGINIEPMPSYHAQFQAQRPRDLNLAVACGARDGEITLYEVPDMNGWASTDAAVADGHRADGYALQEVTVPLRTLNDICAAHVQGPIHFLKIDVEGAEGEVLRGLDLQRWRPWILVIEATLPGQRDSAHQAWEALVTAHDYQFAWFDGLNRYYTAGEHAALREVLALQPNVFDDFISHHLAHAWQAKATLAGQLQDALEQAAAAQGRAADAQAERTALAEQALHDGREANRQVSQALAGAAAAQQRLQETLAVQAEQVRQLAACEAQLILRDGDLARRAEQVAALQDGLAALQDQLVQRETALQDELARRETALRDELARREAQLQGALGELQAALAHSEHARHQAGAWGSDMQQRLLAMEHSRWWRLRGSLLGVGRAPQALLARSRDGALRLVRRLGRSESARRLLIPLQRRFPGLAHRVLSSLRPPAADSAAPAAAAALPDSGAAAECAAAPEASRWAIPLGHEAEPVRAVYGELLRAIHSPTT
ncbi:FkbM family methyltransferase [Pseudoduganella aquatica]|nr:FkbM family methyltransferase [Pseudoduganella aquatica]